MRALGRVGTVLGWHGVDVGGQTPFSPPSQKKGACRSHPLSCVALARSSHFLNRSVHFTEMTAFLAPAWSRPKLTHVSVTSGNMCFSLLTFHVLEVVGTDDGGAVGITVAKSWWTDGRGPKTQIQC